jgi:hypothetical protein
LGKRRLLEILLVTEPLDAAKLCCAHAMKLKALMERHLKLLKPETDQYTIELSPQEDQKHVNGRLTCF